MKRLTTIIVIAICCLALSSLAGAQGFTYSGSLDLDGSTTGTEDGYITGTGTWSTGPTSIRWDVSWNGSEQYVHYSYTVTYPSHDPSYFIFEVSQDFTSSDITNVRVDGVLLPYINAENQTFLL